MSALYTARLRLASSLITPLHADTLFGHLCWAMRYVEGEAALQDFLLLYHSEPPLVLSNGFPAGMLPMPSLPALTPKERNELLGVDPAELIRNAHKLKRVKRFRLAPDRLLANAARDGLSPRSLWAELLRLNEQTLAECAPGKPAAVQHNTVNRVSIRVEEGLYHTNEVFYPEGQEITIYYRLSDDFPAERLETILRAMCLTGYGKKKNVGKGAMEFLSLQEGGPPALAPEGQANGFLALSNFVPAAGDPTEGFYLAAPKYGKLGGDFAVGPMHTNGQVKPHNPFKRPLLMLQAGAVFAAADGVRNHYGRMVRGVHAVHPHIVHYGCCLPLPLRLDLNHFPATAAREGAA